jgi:hypothetical protein
MRFHVLVFVVLPAIVFAQDTDDPGCGSQGDLCFPDSYVPGSCCDETNGYTMCTANSSAGGFALEYTSCGTGYSCGLDDDNTPTCAPNGEGNK